jgi:predicted nucleotidyltransferase
LIENGGISMVTKEQVDEIVKRIVENYRPEKIILFGSYAYGTPSEESDLDLLIIKDSNLPRYKRGREVRKYLRGLKLAIDLVVYTKEEIQKWSDVRTAFITTVMEKGNVLYG